MVDEIYVAVDGVFAEEGDIGSGKFFEVGGGGRAGDAEVLLEGGDAGVGVEEQGFDKVAAVEFESGADEILGVGVSVSDLGDGPGAHSGSFDDGIKHEEEVGFPFGVTADAIQQTVIESFSGNDVAAEVEDRGIEEAAKDEVEDVEDAAGAAISVIERVDGLELIVEDGHFDERVDIGPEGIVVDYAFKIGKEGEDFVAGLGGRVDDFAGGEVFESGAGL